MKMESAPRGTPESAKIGSRTVAFCDILGFSNLVQNHPLGDVVDRGIDFLRRALHHSLNHGDYAEGAVPTLMEMQDNPHLGIAWFSDSIFLFTLDDTDESLRRLLETLAWLHFETITAGFMMSRSGVSYGEVFIDPENSIFLGKPIIDAYRLEEDQEWSGGALTVEAVDRVPDFAKKEEFVDWWVKPYHVPLKQGQVVETLAIYWSLGVHPLDWEMCWNKESKSPTSTELESNAVARKFLNTHKFHEDTCIVCA